MAAHSPVRTGTFGLQRSPVLNASCHGIAIQLIASDLSYAKEAIHRFTSNRTHTLTVFAIPHEAWRALTSVCSLLVDASGFLCAIVRAQPAFVHVRAPCALSVGTQRVLFEARIADASGLSVVVLRAVALRRALHGSARVVLAFAERQNAGRARITDHILRDTHFECRLSKF